MKPGKAPGDWNGGAVGDRRGKVDSVKTPYLPASPPRAPLWISLPLQRLISLALVTVLSQ